MAFKGFNQDSLDAMAEQSGIAPAAAPVVKEGTPDIKVVEPKVDPEIAKAEEARIANEAAEAKKVEDAKAAEAAKIAEETKIDLNDDKVINKTVEDSGLDLNDIKSRIIKDGAITDETKAILKEKIDPALVDSYVESFEKQIADAKKSQEPATKNEPSAADKAQVEMNDFIYNSVGGKDTFGVLATTIKEGADATDVSKINAKLASTNKDLVKEGLEDAVKIYNKLTGRGDKLMSGDANADANVPAFKFVTKKQYLAQVATEKYQTDPAYAKEVDDARMKSIEMDNAQTLPGQYRNFRNGEMYDL